MEYKESRLGMVTMATCSDRPAETLGSSSDFLPTGLVTNGDHGDMQPRPPMTAAAPSAPADYGRRRPRPLWRWPDTVGGRQRGPQRPAGDAADLAVEPMRPNHASLLGPTWLGRGGRKSGGLAVNRPWSR